MKLLQTFFVCLLAVTRVTNAAEREPYVQSSLANATDEEVVRFMTRGTQAYDLEEQKKIRSNVPEGFWSGTSREACLAYIEANRPPEQQQRFEISFDESVLEPDLSRSALVVTWESCLCNFAHDRHFLLCVSPEKSWLAYATCTPRAPALNDLTQQSSPVFDLRRVPVPYEDALRIARVVWWLGRARAILKEKADAGLGFPMLGTHSDGRCHLLLQTSTKTLIEHAGVARLGNLSERIECGWQAEEVLNFARHLVMRELPRRLGKEAAAAFEGTWSPQEEGPRQRRMNTLSHEFLAEFAQDERWMSAPLAAQAARHAGHNGNATARSALQKLAGRPALHLRSADSIGISELHNQMDRTNPKTVRDVIEARENDLQHAIQLSLLQLDAFDNASALASWAVEKRPACLWALQRLRALDSSAFAGALEQLIQQAAQGDAPTLFTALYKVDPTRAKALLQTVGEKARALRLLHRHLEQSEERPSVSTNPDLLLTALFDADSSDDERQQALWGLPTLAENAPEHRATIVEAVTRLLTIKHSFKPTSRLRQTACNVLAAYGSTTSADLLWAELWNDETDSTKHLSSIVQLAMRYPGEMNPRLVEWLRQELKISHRHIEGLFCAIWAADLREFSPTLALLATRSPEEVEDPRVHSVVPGPKPLKGPTHLARQILSLWQEPDHLTRVRMLTAFIADGHQYYVLITQPENLIRWQTLMKDSYSSLKADDRSRFEDFLLHLERPVQKHENAFLNEALTRERRAAVRHTREWIQSQP